MLENNFNILDNDYVTLWSRYLTSGSLDLNTLTKLAELGQIEAIQSYYLAEEDEQFPNFIIAKICDNLPDNYSGRHARLNREFINRNIKEPDINDIFLDKYYGELTKIITLAKIDYEENGNVMSGEKYLELFFSNVYNPDKKNNSSNINKLAKDIREKLIEMYERMGEPQYAFALGKNMVYFADSVEMNEYGITLLKELANREYSKKLNKYIIESNKMKSSASEFGD